MKTKKNYNSLIELWKKRIMAEKEIPAIDARQMADKIMNLICYMRNGYVIIAYRKQDGKFCMEKATLMNYEKEFQRKFEVERIPNSIPYWSIEKNAWRTFRMENLLEWKKLV